MFLIVSFQMDVLEESPLKNVVILQTVLKEVSNLLSANTSHQYFIDCVTSI